MIRCLKYIVYFFKIIFNKVVNEILNLLFEILSIDIKNNLIWIFINFLYFKIFVRLLMYIVRFKWNVKIIIGNYCTKYFINFILVYIILINSIWC